MLHAGPQSVQAPRLHYECPTPRACTLQCPSSALAPPSIHSPALRQCVQAPRLHHQVVPACNHPDKQYDTALSRTHAAVRPHPCVRLHGLTLAAARVRTFRTPRAYTSQMCGPTAFGPPLSASGPQLAPDSHLPRHVMPPSPSGVDPNPGSTMPVGGLGGQGLRASRMSSAS